MKEDERMLVILTQNVWEEVKVMSRIKANITSLSNGFYKHGKHCVDSNPKGKLSVVKRMEQIKQKKIFFSLQNAYLYIKVKKKLGEFERKLGYIGLVLLFIFYLQQSFIIHLFYFVNNYERIIELICIQILQNKLLFASKKGNGVKKKTKSGINTHLKTKTKN